MMKSFSLHLAVGLCGGLIFASWSPAACAESPNFSTAQSLFTAGRKLADRGQYAAACVKFEESERVEPGMGTEFHLAKCWEKLGRTASAWAMFLRVASQANAANQTERSEVARRRAEALEPRLSRLKIEVQAPSEALEIWRDQTPLGRASWSEAVPLDPGDYEISARAPGRRPHVTHVVVPDSAGTLSVVIPELELDASPANRAPKIAAAESVAKPPLEPTTRVAVPETTSQHERSSRSLWLPITLAAVGVAGLATGTYFAFDFEKVCPTRDECRGTARDRAKTDRTIAYSGWAIGGTAVAAAVAAYIAGRGSHGSQGAWVVSPEYSPTHVGALLTTSF